MSHLQGQTAIVTGGSRGIGKAIVERLATDGANVVIFDINEEALSEAEQSLQDKGLTVQAIQADVTNRDQVTKAVQEVMERFGSLEILVNNAGVIRDQMFYKMSEQDWDTVMNVHLKGAFIMTQIAQAHMIKQSYGRIINLSSTSALGNRGQANYATAKAGLQGFTKTMAIELGKYGVTTNAIAPGFIETDMTRSTADRLGISFEQLIEASVAKIPVARSGKPEDIANTVAFFADPRSGFVNGQVIYVAGGPKA
ncbi:SDR family NAD(P)-dependent oxidoreductase [Shouchella sp. JSM 1781072]|uniref:SDR family NAD(P)-dependent oxidoreductase n=1 Tax=Bacillaceae TaxID=186817 RepID=UPI0020D1CE89|nr:3-oxoacyl-ACP reductase FabG [Alkalihalobacillus sp. LMS6]UTR07137.1 3-oxoacyl-ACP reductase FabG [Alkalihalobacillus sp. LMS6]